MIERTIRELKMAKEVNTDLIFNMYYIDNRFDEALQIQNEALRIPNAWVVLCTTGSIELLLAGDSYTLGAGMLCVAPPETLVKLVGASDDFSGYLALSGSKFIEKMVRYNVDTLTFFEQTPRIRLEEDEYTALISLCRTSERYALRKSHPFYNAFMGDLGSLFLLELLAIYERLRQERPQDLSRKQQHYMDFIFLLKKHCDDRWTVERYANELNITPRYLTKVCQTFARESAVGCINRYTVDQICIRLLSSSDSALEISEQMNFQNMSYFISLFKKYKGCTPQQYRRNPNRHRQ